MSSDALDRVGTTPRRRAGAEVARDPSIDAFRGLAVLLMALGNFEIGVRLFPAALKHAPDIGFTIADLVAPMFVVAIGLTIGTSMRRRRTRDGTAAAYGHLAVRSLALVGIGAIISAGHVLVRPATASGGTWGVLQCLGTSCLLLLPVVFRPTWQRALVGTGLLVTYQWLLDRYWLDTVLGSSHNGLPGVIAWAGLLMLATAVGDRYHQARDPNRQSRLLLTIGVAATVVGLVLAPWLPISKNRASLTYMLLSLGLCLLVLLGCHLLLRDRPAGALWLQRVGRNPLVLYLVNLLLLGVLTLPATDWWYAGAPLWLALSQAAVIVAVTIGLAAALDRRDWVVSL
jgi:alpha-N-acetylglucosaminidase